MSGLDYDFSAGEDIPNSAMKDAFLNLKGAADSDDPDKRYDVLESMKFLAKTDTQYGGGTELREATLAVMQEMMEDDPDEEVRERASREHRNVTHYHETMTARANSVDLG